METSTTERVIVHAVQPQIPDSSPQSRGSPDGETWRMGRERDCYDLVIPDATTAQRGIKRCPSSIARPPPSQVPTGAHVDGTLVCPRFEPKPITALKRFRLVVQQIHRYLSTALTVRQYVTWGSGIYQAA